MLSLMAPPEDIEVLRRCLHLAVDGPYFSDAEFHTLMGLSRDEMRAIAEAWPEPTAEAPPGYESAEEAQNVAVNNAANNLVGGYPHGVPQNALEEELGCRVVVVAHALASWRGESGFDASGKGYFDRLM
ncbi:MAG: hypothetical protein AAGH15_23370 [Myxococcota bacterium]